MSIGEFCTRETVVAEKSTGIVELARLMRKHHVGDVIVVEKQGDLIKPVGIVTDRDIVVELVAAEVDFESVHTGDIMSRELVTGKDTDGIWDTLQRMRSKGIRRLPVVNRDGGLEGILTVNDLIELIGDELSVLADITGRGREKEREKRG